MAAVTITRLIQHDMVARFKTLLHHSWVTNPAGEVDKGWAGEVVKGALDPTLYHHMQETMRLLAYTDAGSLGKFRQGQWDGWKSAVTVSNTFNGHLAIYSTTEAPPAHTQALRLATNTPLPFTYGDGGGYSGREEGIGITADHPMYAEVVRRVAADRGYYALVAAALARVRTALKVYVTVNQLLAVWPELVNFMPANLLERVGTNKSRMSSAPLRARLPSHPYSDIPPAEGELSQNASADTRLQHRLNNDDVTELLSRGKIAESLGANAQDYSLLNIDYQVDFPIA